MEAVSLGLTFSMSAAGLQADEKEQITAFLAQLNAD
jgi:hypothetical protein